MACILIGTAMDKENLTVVRISEVIFLRNVNMV